MGSGLDYDFLLQINEHLIRSDLDCFFDGERFQSGIEKNHTHEQNDTLMQVVRSAHQKLAQQFSWHPINANRSIQEIQSELQKIITERFF